MRPTEIQNLLDWVTVLADRAGMMEDQRAREAYVLLRAAQRILREPAPC